MGKPQKVDADYLIDYEKGKIPISDLPIGARVVDPSWVWEFRTGNNYTGSEEIKEGIKPVTWIIVAKDHYAGLEPHVTLLSEELIGKYAFDNSTDWGHAHAQYGCNHWGDSGTANATLGLRPWLNSTGTHSGEGFYRTFSESFKEAALTTALPNKEWKNGTAYSTSDHVFLPSTTELGDSAHKATYRIGSAYPYFSGANDTKRVAHLVGETLWSWTRSPVSNDGVLVRLVDRDGEFSNLYFACDVSLAVRPALNLKSGILVSEIKN